MTSIEELHENSCLMGDGSGLKDEDKPKGVQEPEVDLDELATTDAKPLQFPQYLAHEYRQDRYDFSRGRPNGVHYVVMHFMAGSFWGGISWNLDNRAQTSWHYAVADDGYTVQTLSEYDRGWHSGNWHVNDRSVGIECSGHGRPEDWTEAKLQSAAKLVAGICHRHNIPITRSRIFGHSEVKGATHTDVGRHFPWRKFMRLVRHFSKQKARPEPSPQKPQEPHRAFLAPGRGEAAQRLADAAVRALRGAGVNSHVCTDKADHDFALYKTINGKLGEYIYMIIGPAGWEMTDKERTKNSGEPGDWLGRDETDIWPAIYPGDYESRRDQVAHNIRLLVNRDGGNGDAAVTQYYELLSGKA